MRKLAGLPDDLVLYSLRHNFASQLVMAGVDLLTVAKLMTHSDIQTTIQCYVHLRSDHARDAVEGFASQGLQQARDHATKTPKQRKLAAVPANH